MNPIFRHLVLIARVVVGGIFMAHGYQKVIQDGVSATATSFDRLGFPVPYIAAAYAGYVELAAGLALIIGLLLPLAAVLLAIDMLGYFLFVNAKHGVYIANNGFELVAVLGMAALLIGFSGGGTLALDRLFFRRRRRGASPP